MLTEDRDRLIDEIYAAALIPEHWPAILDELTRIASGAGAIIFTASRSEHRFIGTKLGVEIHEQSISSGWQEKNDRGERLFGAGHAGFLNDLDVYTREEIDQHPYFTEFLRPRGLGWGVATAIEVPGGDMIAVDVEMPYANGPASPEIVAELDRLRPHLARAGLVSARMALEKAKATTHALGMLGFPAAIVAQTGRLTAANAEFEALVPAVFTDRRDRLSLIDRVADPVLGHALATLDVVGARRIQSIPVAAREDRPPSIVHVVPIRREARDIFSGALALLVVTVIGRAASPPVELIQGLFDLTPTEARIARSLGLGSSLNQIAADRGVSVATVRSQLKGIFAKTGVARQAELTMLLAGITFGQD